MWNGKPTRQKCKPIRQKSRKTKQKPSGKIKIKETQVTFSTREKAGEKE